MDKDVADEVAPLEELLKTAINRAKIALMLVELNQEALLPTILEDLFRGCQDIIDHHCVKK